MTFAPADFLWALESLARLHRVPIDPTLAAQQFPPPYAHEALLRAGANMGLRFHPASVDAAGVDRLAFPCLAFTRAAVPRADDHASPAILVAVEAGRLLYFTRE